MEKVSPEDLSLFKTITCENDNNALIYLLRYPDVNTAISNYFSAKETESTQALPNGNSSQNSSLNLVSRSQSNINFGTQNNSENSNTNTIQRKTTLIRRKTREMEIEEQPEPKQPADLLSFKIDESRALTFPSERKRRENGFEIEKDFEEEEDEDNLSEMCDKYRGSKDKAESPVDDNVAQFMAITNCDQETAKRFLNLHKKLETAIDEYFTQDVTPQKPTPKKGYNKKPKISFVKRFAKPANRYIDSEDELMVEEKPFINHAKSSPFDLLPNPATILTNSFSPLSPMSLSDPLQNLFPAPFIKTKQQQLQKAKENIESFVKKPINPEDNIKSSQWPKYLGSIIVGCRLSSLETMQRLKEKDKIEFEANNIEFSSVNITRKKKNADGEYVKDVIGKNWYIKGGSLIVNCKWNNSKIGTLECDYEEVFVFLLARKYILLEGTIAELQEFGYQPVKLCLNIYLTEEVVKNPLNVISLPPGKKRKTKNGKEVEDKESQKLYQLLRLSKESFVKLFKMLELKVTIPAIVSLRQRIDPFQRIRRDKYMKGRSHRSRGNFYMPTAPPAELVKMHNPQYYASNNNYNNNHNYNNNIMNNMNMMTSNKKNLTARRRRVSRIDDDDFDFDDEDSFDSLDDGLSSGFSAKESDEELLLDVPKKEENQDLLTTNQISSYYAVSQPPLTLKTELHAYQKQALSWMKYREEMIDRNELFEKEPEKQRMLNDLFQEMVLLDGSKLYFNPFNGEVSLDLPTIKACKGGILADEMGLGKTVMTIALLHSHRRNPFTQENLLELKEESEEEKEPPKTQKKKITKKKSKNDLEMEEEFAPTKQTTLTEFLANTKPKRQATLNSKRGFDSDEDDSFDEDALFGKKTSKKVKGEKKVAVKSKTLGAKTNEDTSAVNLPTTLKKAGKRGVKVTPHKKVQKTDKKFTGTLIVVPLTVLSQWEKEIERHSEEGTLSVLQYYGNTRKDKDLQKYDVVLTTYGVIENEYAEHLKKKIRSELFESEWFRIILDEAHYIKSRQTKTAKATCNLKAEYRWCLTGTPLQNKLDDMFSLLQFLKVDTWGEYFWWNTYINKYVSQDEASNLIRGILKPLILRRTKKSTYLDGRNILELPPKELHNTFIKLTEEERSVYNCFFQKSSAQFNQMVDGGTLGYEYAHVFELLIRLRQVCDHSALVFSRDDLKDRGSLENAVYKFLEKKLEGKETPMGGTKREITMDKGDNSMMKTEFIQKTIENLKNKELEPCCICLEEITLPAIANCGHIFCKYCLQQCLENTKRCPLCQSTISGKDVMTITLEDQAKCSDLFDINGANFKKSAKLTAVIEAVKGVVQRKEKVVIFSQFIGMLNLIERFLKEEKVGYRKIDGSSTMKNRVRMIDDFNQDETVNVFLVSLKCGAIGLNLTVANNVYLVDPWWNPAVEDQAIERVHRIGQKNKVNVVRFICEKTIEERIQQLNAQKKVMINSILQFNAQEQKKQNMENMMYVMRGFDDES